MKATWAVVDKDGELAYGKGIDTAPIVRGTRESATQTLELLKDCKCHEGGRPFRVVELAEATDDRATLSAEVERYREMLNTPEIHHFARGVVLEAHHQRQRWGADHDDKKEPEEWYWLFGYLAGKALAAVKAGDMDKARHHTISSGAALANWHRKLNAMSPPIPSPGMDEGGMHGEVLQAWGVLWMWSEIERLWNAQGVRVSARVFWRPTGTWVWSAGYGTTRETGSESTRWNAMKRAIEASERIAGRLDSKP